GFLAAADPDHVQAVGNAVVLELRAVIGHVVRRRRNDQRFLRLAAAARERDRVAVVADRIERPVDGERGARAERRGGEGEKSEDTEQEEAFHRQAFQFTTAPRSTVSNSSLTFENSG